MVNHHVLQEIQALFQKGNALGTAAPVSDTLQAAVELVAALLPSESVHLAEINTKDASVELWLWAGARAERASLDFRRLQDTWGPVLSGGTPVLSSKRDKESGAVIAVPLMAGGETLGLIVASHPETDFDQDDLDIVVLVANYCSMLISNGKLHSNLQRANELTEATTSALKQQQMMKDRLFSIIAQDLRSSIGNTSVILEFISDQFEDLDDLAEIVHSGKETANQTYNLLENLVSWVRSQITEVQALKARISVAQILSHVTAWLESQAKLKQVDLVVECAEGLSVIADERMLETIVRNFVSNAIKYSKEGSPVTVRGFARDALVFVEVIDTGVGMASERRVSLFGVQKVDSEPGTNGERGNGLGLMFCADLARNLGGRLEVESTVEHGSTFRLMLPDSIDGEL